MSLVPSQLMCIFCYLVKCCNTLLNSISVAPFGTYVILFTCVIPNLSMFYVAYQFFPIYLRWPISFYVLDLVISISQSHTLQALPHAISSIPLIHDIDEVKIRWITKLANCIGCLAWFCCWNVCLCCVNFYLIAWTESYVFCWEKRTLFNYQKGKWHSYPTLFYTMH